MNVKIRLLMGVFLLAFVIFTSSAFSWGDMRYAKSDINIRADRTTDSKIVGKLKRGEKVKVDYIKNNWWAIFRIDETTRSESRAAGFVYAPLLLPNRPVSKTELEKEEILKYNIKEQKDYSYYGMPRMAYRIVLNVVKIPSEKQMQKTAKYIWKNGNTSWKEFTVFMYLPETDIHDVAYSSAEFTNKGLKKFTVQSWALMGTKWSK